MNDDAIGTYEALAQRAYLERAATELKASPLFASFSRRLLFDLVERNGVHVLRDSPGFPDFLDEASEAAAHPQPGPFLAIVVLEGTVLAVQTPQQADGHTLRPGVHLRSDLALVEIPTGQLRLKTPDAATLLAISAWTLADSPTTAWSLDLRALSKPFANAPAVKSARRAERIWVSASADMNVPLEAAMHILGAALAREISDAPVALYILAAPPQYMIWDGERFVSHPPPNPHDFLQTEGKRDRILFGHPTNPMHRPKEVDFLRFDRVVHLTKQTQSILPHELREILHSGLHKGGAESIFSSFVASVLVDHDPKPTHPVDLCCKGEFEARPLPCGAPDDPPMRPYRDSCALRVHSPRLRRAWETWIQGGAEQDPPFVEVAANKHAMHDETSKRWARAVTNRRVGFALSGGGASAYRAGPLLSRIYAKNIPIDVFAALSGGALVGAFCCGADPGGFSFVKSLGPFFQMTLPGVLVWTWPFEAVVDFLLGGTRVEDLERRYAAVAVELPDRRVPRATVVVKGTLGEAVRVSGNLPPSFAPATKNWTRYTDGGAGTVVPARVARDCGADVVLACNAVPGPSRGNPFSVLPGAAFLLRWTPFVGRVIDSYTWYAFFFQQTSREFSRHAEVFVEFAPQAFPLFESTAFIAASWIADQAENEGATLDEKVDDLKREWLKVRPPPPPPPPPAAAPPGPPPRPVNRPPTPPTSGGRRSR